jgi:homoserine kinase
MEQVTIRIPASTSNLGPGFDCLGVALRLYNFVTVNRTRNAIRDLLSRPAAELFFQRAKKKSFPFSVSITGDVPQSRGLGSSATVRLGTLHGLNVLAGRPLTRTGIYDLAVSLEGHPDNVAPAEFGGFNIGRAGEPQRFKVSSRLQFVLLIPELEIVTRDARRLLPDRISHLHAVESCRAACGITAAFASRRYENLRGAFVDYLHQPYRKKLVPFLDRVIRAGEEAGALGGFLSGSGSTIICVTLSNAKKVASAMRRASGKGHARTIITVADNFGARITAAPATRHSPAQTELRRSEGSSLVTSYGPLA